MTCGRCGRPLRGKQACELGYGRKCIRKMQAAIPPDAKPFQIDKALDLIRDCGLIPLRPRCRGKVIAGYIFKCVSSGGTQTYLTAREACTCPAGMALRLCYHRIAALMLSA